PTAGTISVNGTDFVKDGKQVIGNKKLQLARRKIGMIFQNFNLLNEITVVENVAFALRHSGLKDKEITAKAQTLLELVDLKDKANFYPSQLSGGQQQRVAIARALANEPDILISDEATSALDPQNTQQILKLLKKLQKELNLTIVLITHEMNAVKKICNKVAVMQQGQVVEEGSLRDVVLHPQNELTQSFVGGSREVINTLKLLNLDKLNGDEAIYQLVYSMANVTKTIIVDLYRKVGVEASMLYGNVELLNDDPIGTLLVLVKGNQEQQEATVRFLTEEKVAVTRLNEKGKLL
ncbi:methionine ABC transporter ATP-binding protein, partial [Lactobacillus sp. XV13L]|nr:methionine ABC transporter ATP-binding protein [Lactobacillus sp. XV13L]